MITIRETLTNIDSDNEKQWQQRDVEDDVTLRFFSPSVARMYYLK